MRCTVARVLVALCALMLGFGTQAHSQQRYRIVTSFSSPHGAHAGLFLALQKGWFKEQGIDFIVEDGKGSLFAAQQVAARQADMAIAQLWSMAAAVSNGLPVISVMGLARAGDNAVIVRRDSPIKTVQDLKGKKIATVAVGGAGVLEPFFRAGGLSPSDVNVTFVDSSALLSTYLSGAVDGIATSAAYILPIVTDKNPSRAISFSDVGLIFPSYGLFVHKDSVAKNPDVIRKVVEINKRAWEYILKGNEDEAADAIARARPQLNMDRKILAAQTREMMKLFDTPGTKGKPLGWQSEEEWNNSLKILIDSKLIKPGVTPAAVFTNDFIPNN